jgi:ATPase family associated with various cellular activities (AAA)
MPTDPPALAALAQQSFDHTTSYHNVIDVQFTSRALASGARCLRGVRWATCELFPGDGPEVLASAYYSYNRSFEALAEVEGALAHVIRQGDNATVRLAAQDQDALDAAERALRLWLPEPDEDARRVPVEFSFWREQRGVMVTSRTLEVPRLADIAVNYPASVRAQLRELGEGFRPGQGGRLMLWHGLPGCGKTWALRALASEWRDLCRLRYVSDPERMLQEPAYLIDLIHQRPGLADEAGWRLVVLEDTGELLAADAKERAGQGLSRLLNVVDGLLGDSSRALFLVTTNDNLRVLHPAVARPGRCARVLEFGPLDPDEANAWLAAQGCNRRVEVPATLAELFAVRDGTDLGPVKRRPVGFA